jgi:antitoxin VapB
VEVVPRRREHFDRNSEAVRLPKQFRFESKELEIFRRGDESVLREKAENLEPAIDLIDGLPADFEILGAI